MEIFYFDREKNDVIGERKHDVAYWGVILVACAVFYWMNTLTLFKEDDMSFALIGRLSSVSDVLATQRDHFMTANGRFSDVLATLFCAFLGKPLFNVLNTLVFALMAHLMSMLATKRCSVLALTAFLAYVGFCYPVPGQTMLFVAGSCNYMWAITASLLLVCYLLRHTRDRLRRGEGVLLVLFSFVAGNFNEATSFGFFAGLVLYYACNRDRWNRRALLALTGYLLGILLIVASPGAWNRAAEGGIVLDMGLGELLSSRFSILFDKMWRFVTPLTAIIVGLGVLAMGGKGVIKRSVWAYIFWCLVLVMFALGVPNDRAYASMATVGFFVTVAVLDLLLEKRPRLRLVFIVGFLAVTGYTFARGLKSMHEYKRFEDNIRQELAEAPRHAVLHERSFMGYPRFATPLCFVSSYFFVREDIYCSYYDKDNVQFVSDSVYDRYHSGRLLDGAHVLPFKSDRTDIVDTVLSIPGQDYMVALLKCDTIPFSSQQACYHTDHDYSYCGFYPLRYHDRHLLVLHVADSTVNSIVFPIDRKEPLATRVTLTR